MIIKCWGARGSTPVSGKEFNRYGGDTTCVEVRSKTGDVVIIDAGTGIRGCGNRLLKEETKNIHILLTHTHWDHIQGFPFFSPLYNSETRVNIFGHSFHQTSVKEMITPLFIRPYFPVSFDDMKAKIEYLPLSLERFSIGPLSITPILISHPDQGLGYKFTEDGRSFVFLTDNELQVKHPGGLEWDDYTAFCSKADLLIHDAMFTEEEYQRTKGWGHSTFSDALQLAAKAGVKHLGVTHHYQERTDENLDDIVKGCRQSLQTQRADLTCFGVRQDMEINLNQDSLTMAKDKSEDPLGQAEVDQLKEKIRQHQIEKEEAVQQAVAGATNEASQLKNTISALRDEMEKKEALKDECVQQTKAVFTNEMNQLKETIQAQRDSMTKDQISYEEKLQATKQSLQNESNQLKQTISTLREKLEGYNGQ